MLSQGGKQPGNQAAVLLQNALFSRVFLPFGAKYIMGTKLATGLWLTIIAWDITGKCLFIKLCYNGCGFPTKGFLRLDLTSSEGTKACLITKQTMVSFVKYHLDISRKNVWQLGQFKTEGSYLPYFLKKTLLNNTIHNSNSTSNSNNFMKQLVSVYLV